MKFESIINDVCCDRRVKDGTLCLENADHIFVLQEYLEKAGFSLDEIVNKTAKLFESGRFPLRQAFNKEGILVTFPNKAYRDRAVDKGTHFAENPKKNTGTLYSTTDAGGLSTADVAKTPGADTPEADKPDSVSLDQELNKNIAGDDTKDNRSAKDKAQDAEAVKSMLTGDMPLVNFSVAEAISLGYQRRGFEWYNTNNELIGEQVYDEAAGGVIVQTEKAKAKKADTKPVVKPPVLKATKKEPTGNCDATNFEFNLDKEINGVRTDDSAASKIAADMRRNGITKSKSLGREGCPITDPLFKQLNTTSKTDLIFDGKTYMRASLKNQVAQICSAQNAETNAVVSTVLKNTGADIKTMEAVSSFIMQGLEKNWYVALKDEAKEKLNKALTAVINGRSIKDVSGQVADIEKLVSANKTFASSGEIPVDIDVVLAEINSVFSQPDRRRMLVEELATGKYRFATAGAKPFAAQCIADHMMTWNCEGMYHIYTVEKFIDDNANKISFRFSNRGGVRGIAIRADFKSKLTQMISSTLNESQLDESFMDAVKRVSSSLSNFFKDIYKKIELLAGDAKEFFLGVWERIKQGLENIYKVILQVGRFVRELISLGWETFMDVLGFDGKADGSWYWKSPVSHKIEVPVEDSNSTFTDDPTADPLSEPVNESVNEPIKAPLKSP